MGQNYSDLNIRQDKVTSKENKDPPVENQNKFSGSGKSDDPRSPSERIDRTPLRNSSKLQRNVAEYRRFVNDTDPRSPCGEINRTPIKGAKPKDGGVVIVGQRLFDQP